jgi:hypothetical protein
MARMLQVCRLPAHSGLSDLDCALWHTVVPTEIECLWILTD